MDLGLWLQEYPFDPNWLDLPGARMHYVDEGPKDAPIMLMVHGNPTWSFYYRRLIAAFSGEFRCIVPDHIGCGLSDKPQDYAYTLAQRIRDVDALMASIDSDAPVTLVIHDWGGAIGMGWAGLHHERIDRVVVFNTAAFLSERIPLSINACRVPGFGEVAVRGFNGFVRVAQVRAIHDSSCMTRAARSGYLAPYNSWANRVAVHEFVRDIPMSPDHPTWHTMKQVEQGLEHFKDTPMLIVWGERDFCFNDSFRKEWSARFPQADVHIMKDASHYVLEEEHKRIIPWMKTFVGHEASPKAV